MAQLLDALIILFLLSHIPITIFVDSQAVLPKAWYPEWAKAMSQVGAAQGQATGHLPRPRLPARPPASTHHPAAAAHLLPAVVPGHL